MKRNFSLRNLQKQLNGKTKLSEFGQIIEGETDVDHLLENCEQIDDDGEYNEVHHQKKESRNTKSTEEENQDQDLDKYKIPSSMIVLNDEEKKRLEYVLLQIGLREVGLA